MTELQYPFDAAYILKKKKALKKALLQEPVARTPKKIAVLGGSTTSDLVKMLELFLLNAGIEPTFYESEYAQYFQDACFPGEDLKAFQPDIVWIHTTNRNVETYPGITDTPADVDAKFEAEMMRFRTMWTSIQTQFCCPIIQNNFEMPFYRLLGNRDAYDIHGKTHFLRRLNQAFAQAANEMDTLYLNDLCYLAGDYGLSRWTDPEFWTMYKYAMSYEAIPTVAFSVAGIIKSLFGKNKKALALDLDNTLWGGVVGDDGVEGIEIGQETGVAQAYYEFQRYVKELGSLGILLTVCSKNDYENAIAGLSHPEGALRPDDFVLIKANWDPKDRNIAETAAQLNIFPDAFVFADDNPAERAIVQAQLPGIAVPAMDGVENYIRVIDRNAYFEVTSFGEDDLKRGEMYKSNARRSAAQATFADYGAYLESLEMRAVIDDFPSVYLARITQLTNKSNQFNLTTKRYTLAEMEQTAADDRYIRLYGKLVDKFGDNGVVSVVIGQKNGDVLDVILWLMSCRVLKRDMEQAMLDRLVERCRDADIRTIRGYYYPTAKNGMVRELYRTFGFEKIREDDEGNTVWELPVAGYVPQNRVIDVYDNDTFPS
ncbi:MAG: HAD family hydrolase [Clostridia bacterium]|nr:HAD family hydrolase [Clostridia bacterium]